MSQEIEPPLDNGEGRDMTVVKIALNFVPVVGGSLAELVGHLHDNVAKRQEAWAVQVSDAINELSRRSNLTVDQLLRDEAFVSFVLQATPIALRTHRTEKVRALKSALVSVGAAVGIDEDVASQFLRYIDELTPSHLRILQVVQDSSEQFSCVTTMERAIERLGPVVSHAPVGGLRLILRTYLHDLNARGLVNASDLQELPEFESRAGYLMVEESDRTPLQVTELGRSFLCFITDGGSSQDQERALSPIDTSPAQAHTQTGLSVDEQTPPQPVGKDR